MLKVIKQRTSRDCLIASFAMASGITYDELMDEMVLVSRNYHPQELVEILIFKFKVFPCLVSSDYKLRNEGTIDTKYKDTKFQMALKYDCVLLLNRGHAVAWCKDRRLILDPKGATEYPLTKDIKIDHLYIIRK